MVKEAISNSASYISENNIKIFNLFFGSILTLLVILLGWLHFRINSIGDQFLQNSHQMEVKIDNKHDEMSQKYLELVKLFQINNIDLGNRSDSLYLRKDVFQGQLDNFTLRLNTFDQKLNRIDTLIDKLTDKFITKTN